MILCEWDAPEGNPDNVAYTCMLSYPIIVSHLRFNFFCLLLLYGIYLCGLPGPSCTYISATSDSVSVVSDLEFVW